MGDYNIENIYQGGYSNLDPEKAGPFVGYRIGAGKFGMATDPRTANILQDVSNKLQSGIKHVEVSTIQPEVFDTIPKQQLQEVNRLAKLTGAEISVHGMIVEPSGIGQQGYNELAREQAERQMLSNVMRAHDMSPDGNVPVTFHSSAGYPSPEYKQVEEGGEKRMEKWRMPIINQDTGQVTLAKTEMKYYPTRPEDQRAILHKAEEQSQIMNDTEWSDSITALIAGKDMADRMMAGSPDTERVALNVRDKINRGYDASQITQAELNAYNKYRTANLQLSDLQKHLNSIFSKAYTYADEEKRKQLDALANNFRKELSESHGLGTHASEAMGNFMHKLYGDIENGIDFAPEIYKPVEDFAVDKSGETFGNVAFGAYKKFKNTAPIVSIENPPVGMGLSRAEDLKKVVRVARDQFVKKAKEELHMNEREAQEQADKLIGVTWDVGHINMLRKQGFSEKDVIKESEKIAPLLKHVHLSDNFGYEHTELPMGMGNVPIKEIMNRLGEKGFEAKKVIEAGNWFQHFKTAPFQETLEAFGSPVYSMKMQPYWNQSIGVQGYFGGYGQMLPQINYETMGSGFSMLPAELGGQRPGGRGSRMSGRPME